MNKTKIRIGNDIRIKLKMPDTYKWDQDNVKSIKAFLINTSLKEFAEDVWKQPRRFPRDP